MKGPYKTEQIDDAVWLVFDSMNNAVCETYDRVRAQRIADALNTADAAEADKHPWKPHSFSIPGTINELVGPHPFSVPGNISGFVGPHPTRDPDRVRLAAAALQGFVASLDLDPDHEFGGDTNVEREHQQAVAKWVVGYADATLAALDKPTKQGTP